MLGMLRLEHLQAASPDAAESHRLPSGDVVPLLETATSGALCVQGRPDVVFKAVRPEWWYSL